MCRGSHRRPLEWTSHPEEPAKMQLALTRSKKVAHPRHGAPSTLQEGALDFGLLTETECSSSLPGTHARVCALERGFFAAGSEVFLFARLDLGAMDQAPHSNGLNLEYSQRNTTRASTARGATSCKNHVALCRMGLTQNSFVLQDSSSSASTNLLNFHDVT